MNRLPKHNCVDTYLQTPTFKRLNLERN